MQAARVIGWRIAPSCSSTYAAHVLGPVLVIATLNIANAIIAEATLSFLGVGMPPATIAGTLISEGQNFLFSGSGGSPPFSGDTYPVVMVISSTWSGLAARCAESEAPIKRFTWVRFIVRSPLLLAAVSTVTMAGCAHQWDSIIDGRLYTH